MGTGRTGEPGGQNGRTVTCEFAKRRQHDGHACLRPLAVPEVGRDRLRLPSARDRRIAHNTGCRAPVGPRVTRSARGCMLNRSAIPMRTSIVLASIVLLGALAAILWFEIDILG